MSPRRSVRLPAILLITGALTACPKSNQTNQGGLFFSLALPQGTANTVTPGASLVINLSALNFSGNGAASTPVPGSATLTVTPSTAGTLAPTTVNIGSTGTANATLTVCSAGPTCTGNVVITGSFSGAGQTVQSNRLTLTIESNNGDGGTADAGPSVGGFTVTSKITNGIGTATTSTTGPAPTTRVPVGSPALTIAIKLTNANKPALAANQGLTLTIPASLGLLSANSDFSNPATSVGVTTDTNGDATAFLIPEATGPVTGTLDISVNESPATVDQEVIEIIVPQELVFTSMGTADGFVSLMGVKGSGYNEQSQVRFAILDSTGAPYLGKATLTFSIPTESGASCSLSSCLGLGGATINPTSSINPDATGNYETTLYSGVAAGTIAVTATATIPMFNPAGGLSATSSTIAIVGAKANARNFSLSCDRLAMPALVGNDCSFMHQDLTTKCTVVLGDRYNNTLGVATQVTWLAEAGLFGPPSTTMAAQPGQDPTGEPNLGRSSNTLRTLNAPLPLNVDVGNGFPHDTPVPPNPWANIEPTRMEVDQCFPSGRMARPRDGLSTIIATTQGEEGFVDSNQNGQWDPGEQFYDLGEPYVDENDNNQYDVGEPFIDVNGNGVYDGPNGVWDANTTIWTVSHVVFTDLPDAIQLGNGDTEFSPQIYWATGAGAFMPGQSSSVGILFTDENLNEPSPTYTTYNIGMFGAAVGSILQGTPTNLIDQWGSMHIDSLTACGPATGTSSCTAAEPNCDCQASTSIAFDAVANCNSFASCIEELGGTYSVPSGAMPGNDTIRATLVTQSVPQITQTFGFPVQVQALPVDAGTPDAGTDAGPGNSGTDAGPGVDAGPVSGPCAQPGACSLAACDEQVCATTVGSAGACDAVAGICEPGNLLVLTNDEAGVRINPGAIPIGAPWVEMTAQDVQGGGLGAGDSVKFTVSNISLGGFVVAQPGSGGGGPSPAASVTVTPSNNLAKVYFVPGSVPGQGTVTVNVTGAETESQTLNIGLVIAGTVAFTPNGTDPFFRVMGVKTSGYNTSSLLRFTVSDSSGNPVRNTAIVQFTVPALGGAVVSPVQAATDQNGQVVTTLFSGSVTGVVSVTATATLESGAVISGNTGTISVVGAKVSAKNFSVTCDHEALNALAGNDCSQMHADLSTTCTAVAGDRFNNVLGISQQFSWLSEAGLFGPPSQTVAAIAGADPTSEPNLGRTANTLRTLNAPLPLNVDNQAGYTGPTGAEPTRSVTTACGTRTARPRDGLATFIVATQGEEQFIDQNGNGVYDSGEPFFDLGEPYVDENDNNQWDPGEPFMDTNGNGSYDGPNGVWDSQTTIWTEGHVAFTDAPQQVPGSEPVITLIEPPVPIPLGFNVAQNFTVRWEDENLNEPAPLDTKYIGALNPPFLGGFVQTSPAFLPDRFGSMTIIKTQPCVGQHCTNVYSIDFDSSPEQTGTYTAPSSITAPSGFDDTINFSADLTDVNSTIVAQQVEDFAAPCDTTSPQTVNCQLPACGGLTCSANGVQGLCDAQSQACVANQQAGGTFTLTLAVTNANGVITTRIPAGSTALTLTATLGNTQQASQAANQPITFAIPAGLGTLSASSSGSNPNTTINVNTNANGVATAYFTPENVGPFTGDLIVSYGTGGSTLISIQQLLTVVIPSELVFNAGVASGFTQIMGVKDSGYNEQNIITFTLLDSSGQPYVGTATVDFSIPALGGATLVPTSINTNALGQATTALYSGIAAGTIAVTATTSIQISPTTTIHLSGTSSTIAIVGAKANGRNFSMVCSPLSMPALIGNDCSFMKQDLTSTCEVVIGDRYNNTLGVSTEITWLSESGLFGPPSSTPQAVAGQDPTSEPLLGRSSNTLRTLNAPIPQNVDAQAAYALAVEPTHSVTDQCGTRQARPRDGLSTVIAATQGEEGFIDENANGQWDPGEPFFDLGEPYVDENDNNQFDIGEPFIDVNGNGVWDGPNGVWDSNTTIWTAWNVAFTTLPTSATFTFEPSGNNWGAGFIPDGPTLTPAADWNVSAASFAVFWADENLNIPAQTFTTYSAAMIGSATGSVTQTTLPNLLDSWGAMVVKHPTVCGPPPASHASSCTVASPNCDCQLTTSITFSQGAEQAATYSIANAAMGTAYPYDTIGVSTQTSGQTLGQIITTFSRQANP